MPEKRKPPVDIELPNETGFRDDRLPYDKRTDRMSKMELGQAALDHEAAVEYFKKHPLNSKPQRRKPQVKK